MKLKVNGIDVYYEIHGDTGDSRRPWLVFSHSLACHSAMWQQQTQDFVRDFRIMLFDTRGHGRTEAPSSLSEYSFDILADDALGLFDALAIDRCHFVGLSMGGMLGQALALRYPGRLLSLTVADSVCEWPAHIAAAFGDRVAVARNKGMAALVDTLLGRWFTQGFHESSPSAVASIGEQIRTTPVDGFAGCSAIIPHINTTRQLSRVGVPMLVVVGKEDPATTVAMSQQIHAAAPGSKLFVIDHAAHLSNVEQPLTFNGTLRKFLTSAQ